MAQFIAVKGEGIVEIPKSSFLKRLFCNHDTIIGEACSKNGLRMISGETRITICRKCGKVFNKQFIPYD